jgi:circadian clock protein KaiC
MHELLNYLNQSGITTMLILGQHGLVGDMRSDIDLSYLSDTILLFASSRRRQRFARPFRS